MLAATAYLVITVPMTTNTNESIELKGVLLFASFASPWGYIFGSRIRVDRSKPLNGFSHSAYIGFIVTFLSILTFILYMGLVNVIALPFREVILGSVALLLFTLLIIGLVIFPIGILGATVFWVFVFLYEKHITRRPT